jgi:DNA-binding response OmpR family regulator
VPSPPSPDRSLTPLRAILVEDNPDDARRIARELQRAGFETNWQRVDLEEQFVLALDDDVQLVLSDNGLPAFDAFRVLDVLRANEHPAPLVIVCREAGEDEAVEAVRRGAAGYVVKDRIDELGRAVTRALTRSDVVRPPASPDEPGPRP